MPISRFMVYLSSYLKPVIELTRIHDLNLYLNLISIFCKPNKKNILTKISMQIKLFEVQFIH
jgi:hypothetical protein